MSRELDQARELLRGLSTDDLVVLAEATPPVGYWSGILHNLIVQEIDRRRYCLARAEQLAGEAHIRAFNAQLARSRGDHRRSRELAGQALELVDLARQARRRALIEVAA